MSTVTCVTGHRSYRWDTDGDLEYLAKVVEMINILVLILQVHEVVTIC